MKNYKVVSRISVSMVAFLTALALYGTSVIAAFPPAAINLLLLGKYQVEKTEEIIVPPAFDWSSEEMISIDLRITSSKGERILGKVQVQFYSDPKGDGSHTQLLKRGLSDGEGKYTDIATVPDAQRDLLVTVKSHTAEQSRLYNISDFSSTVLFAMPASEGLDPGDG